MGEFEKDTEERVRQIFRSDERAEFKPSQLLEVKVMAELDRLDSEVSKKRWKWFAILSPVAVSALFLIFLNFQEPHFNVSVNRQVVVKLEVGDVKSLPIAYAEIDLPEGVEFYSERNPEIIKERSLMLAWESVVKNSHLPFVVKSSSGGMKRINIRFFDDMMNLVSEKSLKINFRDA